MNGAAMLLRHLRHNDRCRTTSAALAAAAGASATMIAIIVVDHRRDERSARTTGVGVVRCESPSSSSSARGSSHHAHDGMGGGASILHRGDVPPRTTMPIGRVHRHDDDDDDDDSRRRRRRRGRRTSSVSDKYVVDYDTVLGEGAYGRVHPATSVSTGEQVALKRLSKSHTDSRSFFGSETKALLRIYDNGGHPNISGLRDMYEDEGHYYLFMDLAQGGEMFDHLIRNGQYSEYDASRLVTEILSALAFLHNIGVIHADLKPENVLLCSMTKGAETVKIIDFGCAIVDERDGTVGGGGGGVGGGWHRRENIAASSSLALTTATTDNMPSLGTKAYWSPERFRAGHPVTDAADLYAVGVILYIMLVGVHPFDTTGLASDVEIERLIRSSPTPPMSLASHLSPSARDFIKCLMERDPAKRLTSIAALEHPWIRGVTPTVKSIEGIDAKLSMYQDLRDMLSSGIFAALVDGANLRDGAGGGTAATAARDGNEGGDERTLTHLLKRAFEVFDMEGKGYVNEADLGRVMTKVTGRSMSASDGKEMINAAREERSGSFRSSNSSSTTTGGLSLSDFSQLFSRLGHEHYKRGDYVYRPGDEGDKMFFINSGKIDIETREGHLVSILRHGDFFGEGSLLEDRIRNTAARCSTPVNLIAVSKGDFNKYLASNSIKRSLKLRWKARTLAQAKNLIRLQTNVTKRTLRGGDVVYNEGDIGNSMFLVEDGTLDVRHGGKRLHSLSPGDSFGESSLLFRRPRSSTVICESADCSLHEMRGSDFLSLIDSDPAYARALGDMCRKRMFQKAMKSHLHEVEKAFRDADRDRSGTLSLTELATLMHNMGKNSSIPEKDVKELLHSLDLDDDGQVTLNDVIEMMTKSFK